MKRLIALGALALVLAGCANQEGDTPEKRDLGDFVLGHNIVVAPDLQKGPTSRNATPEELTEAVKAEINKRLGAYEGERLVHLGVNIGGYALARRGVPLVYTPKSALILNVTAWDDRAGTKFNEEPKQFIVFEDFGNAPIVGSGLVNTREEQIAMLTANAAHHIERWLEENAACMTDAPTERELNACWKEKEKPKNNDE